jgi:hypothetical protein
MSNGQKVGSTGGMWSRKHLYSSISSTLGGTWSRLCRYSQSRRNKRRLEYGAARMEGGDNQESTFFSVRWKFVKLSVNGGSLSISMDAGEVHKTTSMIPKKRKPSIDGFGFRTLPSGKKQNSISQVTAVVVPAMVCWYNVEGRKDATRSDEGPV